MTFLVVPLVVLLMWFGLGGIALSNLNADCEKRYPGLKEWTKIHGKNSGVDTLADIFIGFIICLGGPISLGMGFVFTKH